MAANFLGTVGSVQPIKGSTDGIDIPKATQSALDRIDAAGGETFAFRFSGWYLELENEFRNALGALLNDDITPDEFAQRMEAMAERLRNDPDTIRFSRSPKGDGVTAL